MGPYRPYARCPVKSTRPSVAHTHTERTQHTQHTARICARCAHTSTQHITSPGTCPRLFSFAFVKFYTQEAAHKAIREMNLGRVAGVVVRVSRAKVPQPQSKWKSLDDPSVLDPVRTHTHSSHYALHKTHTHTHTYSHEQHASHQLLTTHSHTHYTAYIHAHAHAIADLSGQADVDAPRPKAEEKAPSLPFMEKKPADKPKEATPGKAEAEKPRPEPPKGTIHITLHYATLHTQTHNTQHIHTHAHTHHYNHTKNTFTEIYRRADAWRRGGARRGAGPASRGIRRFVALNVHAHTHTRQNPRTTLLVMYIHSEMENHRVFAQLIATILNQCAERKADPDRPGHPQGHEQQTPAEMR